MIKSIPTGQQERNQEDALAPCAVCSEPKKWLFQIELFGFPLIGLRWEKQGGQTATKARSPYRQTGAYLGGFLIGLAGGFPAATGSLINQLLDFLAQWPWL